MIDSRIIYEQSIVMKFLAIGSYPGFHYVSYTTLVTHIVASADLLPGCDLLKCLGDAFDFAAFSNRAWTYILLPRVSEEPSIYPVFRIHWGSKVPQILAISAPR